MKQSAEEKREALFVKLRAKGVSEGRITSLRRMALEGASPDSIRRLRTDTPKLSVQDIADLFGITRQGVYHHINGESAQLDQPFRTSISALRPFKVEDRHRKCQLYNYLTNHIKWVLAGPEGLSDARRNVLLRWWQTLSSESVIVYDPAETGTSLAACGGWRLDDRIKSDGDMIVRPHGEPTEEQRRVLSWKRIEEAQKEQG
ncbi:hypothetical protein ABZ714_13060 [Streptomyces sp. NPDC006798]|uniref:hypothetical protein n=1 Tax=Streptomyces sp. NPDC006798 TaxID=3155462 RepID=UPI0033DA7951